MGPNALLGQQGDKPGEKQEVLVPKDLIPPAPPLTAEEALKTFKLAPGFRMEIVAADPLIHDPVAISFGPDGRLWVLEMQGFMPDPDGKGEQNPVGTVAVLEDSNGDGRMDKRSVFQDGLVLPRALMLLRDGLLVAEPPNLWYLRDTDGDGKADDKMQVAADYATQADPKLGTKANPEHASNSLMWALDNWIYSANHTVRFRNLDGEWKREPTVFRGQWGMSQDDWGRLVYNSNSDQLRLDLIPAHYLSRNPNFTDAAGRNVDPVKNNKVYPIRVTPGINRGYQPQMLRDGKLASFTAACGPVIYRGDNFPAEFYGNAFVCEPSGNLIKRNILVESNGIVTGRHAYETNEFLTSTDERFRPVNAYTAPDGTLYVVDFYRGILQHRIYLTTYLRQQILDRKLDAPTGLGRIYRVVHERAKPGPAPKLSKAEIPELVAQLGHSNGWWRDTAQKLLIERGDEKAVPPLEKLLSSHPDPRTRIQALYTLDGLGKLSFNRVTNGFRDSHPKVRVHALRLSEPFLKLEERYELIDALMAQTVETNSEVRLQLALTLGEVKESKADQALLKMAAAETPQHLYFRDALLTSIPGRELEFLEKVLSDPKWKDSIPARASLLQGLGKVIFAERRVPRVTRLLEEAAAAPAWQQLALIEGIASQLPVAAKGKAPPKVRLLQFTNEPAAFKKLMAVSSPDLSNQMARVNQLITWPGQPGYVEPPPVIPLNAKQKEQFESGKLLYTASCGACHQASGHGQEGLAPPLLDSEWTTGSAERLIRIVLHGVRGPISVKGKQYDMEMPGLSVFDDEQIAALVTYVRREWEHTASPVSAEEVAKIREAHGNREEAWTEPELLKIK